MLTRQTPHQPHPDSLTPEGRRPGPRRDDRATRTPPGRGRSERIETNDLTLFYQPRVALQTSIQIGAEASPRWNSGRHGVAGPSVFMPILESNGQAAMIGGWMLRAACDAAVGWGGMNVSVDVSVRQLGDGLLLDQVAAALDGSGLAPDLLELELDQSLLADVSTETLLALSAIRDLGVGLALDDYGSGFATLGMLKRLPLTAIKLGRALVRDLQTDADDAVIARAIIQTGRALGFIVAADGIETEAQREILADAGCEEGQGGLFGHARALDPRVAIDHATSREATPSARLAMADPACTYAA